MPILNEKRISLRVSELDASPNGSLPAEVTAENLLNLKYEEGCPLNELPAPGSAAEEQIFRRLYNQLGPIWQTLSSSHEVRETVVVVPSFSLDPEELIKIGGIEYYEERLLFLLIQLCSPRTQVVYVTSQPIRDRIVDYYLQLLPGTPYSHARRRLHMLSCDDASRDKSLTKKVLERPALIQRIRNLVKGSEIAHLSVFNVTPTEKTLSVALNLPLMGADPRFLEFGTKSGCRKLFREAGVLFPDGFEDLSSERDVAEAIVELYFQKPSVRRAVVKINEGFSGEGNAIFKFGDLLNIEPQAANRQKALDYVLKALPSQLKMQAPRLSYESFMGKYQEMAGVVEEFLEGIQKESPSVQTRLVPGPQAQIISTHDQIMGGDDGQVFLGCRFPAAPAFHQALHEGGLKIGSHLVTQGLIERVSIDYLAVPTQPMQAVSPDNPWKMYAIEINLRKGGTTHPFRTLQFLTGGHYNPESGLFTTPSGSQKYYVASDNLVSKTYKGLLPEDLIDIITFAKLHFNSSTHTGVIFHMIGSISQYGKLGLTCIGNSPEHAQELYDRTISTLNRECKSTRWLI